MRTQLLLKELQAIVNKRVIVVNDTEIGFIIPYDNIIALLRDVSRLMREQTGRELPERVKRELAKAVNMFEPNEDGIYYEDNTLAGVIYDVLWDEGIV